PAMIERPPHEVRSVAWDPSLSVLLRRLTSQPYRSVHPDQDALVRPGTEIRERIDAAEPSGHIRGIRNVRLAMEDFEADAVLLGVRGEVGQVHRVTRDPGYTG